MNNDQVTTPAEDKMRQELEASVENLNRSLESSKAVISSFRHLINGLPWDDINSGNFSPEAGCSTVAEVRDRFISLGCDNELLLAGAEREWSVTITLPITLYMTVDATSAEDAEERADLRLDHMSLQAYGGDVDEIEFDSCYAEMEVSER